MRKAIRVAIYSLLFYILIGIFILHICARSIVETLGRKLINRKLTIEDANFQLYRFYVKGVRVGDIFIPEGAVYLFPVYIQLKGIKYGGLHLSSNKIMLEAYYLFFTWRFKVDVHNVSVKDMNKVSDIFRRFGITEGVLNVWINGSIGRGGYIKAICLVRLENVFYDSSMNNVLDLSRKEFQKLYKFLEEKITIDFTYRGKLCELKEIGNYKIGPHTIKTLGITTAHRLCNKFFASKK